jgi:hypothetical protein
MCRLFVLAHKSAVTDDINEEDRRKPPLRLPLLGDCSLCTGK